MATTSAKNVCRMFEPHGVEGGLKGAKGVGLPSVGGCGKQPSSYKTLDSESQSNNPGSKKM